ncbi:hypothetical protein BY458DRAFT_444174 [Sporodiniella umbellata]|nr:hypothetical protein BY458DRAFT_444174 [Sporodiniella umbellata]
MLSKALSVLSLGAALQMVLGSSVDIYYPKTNTVVTTGSTMHIKWHVKDTSVGPIRLQYASGKPTSLNINGIIAENVDASLGSYAWKIPNDLKAKK